MTFVEIRDEIERLLKQVGAYDTDPTPDLPSLANEALQLFSSRAEYFTGETTLTTVSGQSDYAITNPPYWIRITDADYGSQYPLGISSEDAERQLDPLYRRAASGAPLRIWLPRPNLVRLQPKPSAAGVTINISGVRTDTDLDADTDVPSCDRKYHRAIARWAAYLHADAYAAGDERARINGWMAMAMDSADELLGKMAEQVSAQLQRTTRRRRARRVFFGMGGRDGGVISL